MTRWQKGLECRAWNSNDLSNHDQPRPVSRYGDVRRFTLRPYEARGVSSSRFIIF